MRPLLGGLISTRLSSLGRPRYNRPTSLTMDVRLGLAFTTAKHVCKEKCIAIVEHETQQIYSGYRDSYSLHPWWLVPTKCGAIVGLLCGPDLIGFWLVVADQAARHPSSMPDADLLDSSSVLNLQLKQLQQNLQYPPRRFA